MQPAAEQQDSRQRRPRAAALACALLLAAACAAAAGQRFDQGRLWEVSRGGQHRGYVFATMHLDHSAVTTLPAAVEAAFARSSLLLVEVRLDEQAMAEYQRRIWLPPGRRLDELLERETFERLAAIARDYGLTPGQAARLEPWAAANLLARPPPSGRPVLDEVLMQRAREAGKPIEGLERMDALIGALASLPERDHLRILADTVAQHETLMQELEAVRRSYLAGDLTALQALTRDDYDDPALAERFFEAMLYQRTERWLPRIRQALQREEVFVAVGALHLPGERGVLQRLAAAGYALRAVPL